MLDVSRHFFEKEYLIKTIDRLAYLKMNTLHLHLVDDQGWRIEIKKYPKLTEVGAFRVDQEEKPWDGRYTPALDEKANYGGFYTQEDIREIVAYAESRGVTVVPEIEMPAHVTSAVASYPELSCLVKPVAVPSGGLWPITDIYCAGKESTFEFLESVLTEVMDLFPSKYKILGWVLLLIGVVLGIILMINEFDYPNWSMSVFPLIGEESGFLTRNESLVWADNNVADEVASVLMIIGGILVAFSKTKDEDEFISKIRMESLIWATYVNYGILLLTIMLVFDMSFFNVLIYNMFTILFFFILRFNYILIKSRKLLNDEE